MAILRDGTKEGGGTTISDDSVTYRARRVLVIEGTKEFVLQTLKSSICSGVDASCFDGGTISYISTKYEEIRDIEEAELGE